MAAIIPDYAHHVNKRLPTPFLLLTYAGSLVTCAHCGKLITGESKVKRTKSGEREYIYYRCTKYCTEGHPRVRVLERELDTQVLALFRKMRIEDEKVRHWVQSVLRAKVRDNQDASKKRTDGLRHDLGSIEGQRGPPVEPEA
jgi:site-specific DNA recombinase